LQTIATLVAPTLDERSRHDSRCIVGGRKRSCTATKESLSASTLLRVVCLVVSLCLSLCLTRSLCGFVVHSGQVQNGIGNHWALDSRSLQRQHHCRHLRVVHIRRSPNVWRGRILNSSEHHLQTAPFGNVDQVCSAYTFYMSNRGCPQFTVSFRSDRCTSDGLPASPERTLIYVRHWTTPTPKVFLMGDHSEAHSSGCSVWTNVAVITDAAMTRTTRSHKEHTEWLSQRTVE
jgi:hypothetical protein